MMVTVRLFATFREAVGARELSLELPDGADVGQLLATLAERHPGLRAAAGAASFAVNRSYVTSHTPLRQGDEVVLLPPVAGGGLEAAGARAKPFEVVGEEINAAAVAGKVSHPGAGGLVVFTGIVRAVSNSGRPVTHLEYEAYPEMAEEQMAEIAAEIRARWGLEHVAISHRVGRLAVGEVAVAIAVAAPHRREAFAACEYAIDRLKQIAPIWKKEFGPDGAAWVD